MKVLGLEFAPINIPVERRLQTVAVWYWTSCFLFFGLGGMLLTMCILLFTNYYYITIMYALWFWFDRKTSKRGGRRSEWVRNWIIWWWYRDYFPVRLIKSAELDPKKNYICGYHPHGIICVGAFTSFCTETVGFADLYPKIKPTLLTLDVQFRFPIYRDYLLSLGLCSVSRESIEWLLNHQGDGNLVVIVLGGAMEALDAHPGQVRLTLLSRKGFARLALKNGASLVPTFSFGENELFHQIANPKGSFLRQFQTRLTKFIGISPPAFHGRGVFQYTLGYLPFRKPVSVVIGKPIDVEQVENPSEEQVNELHQKYIDGLRSLFDENKMNYEDYKNVELQIT